MKVTFVIALGFLAFVGFNLQQNNCCGVEACWSSTPFTCVGSPFDPCGDQFCGWEIDGWEDDPNNMLFERPIIKYTCGNDTQGTFYVNETQTRGSCDIVVETGEGKVSRSEIKKHVCYKTRPCALSCTVLSTTIPESAWPEYRRKMGAVGPFPITPKKTIYRATCNDGTQTTGPDVVVNDQDYRECEGATCMK